MTESCSHDTQNSACYDVKEMIGQFKKENTKNSNDDSLGTMKWMINPSQQSNSIAMKRSGSQESFEMDTGNHTPRDRIKTSSQHNQEITTDKLMEMFEMIKNDPELTKKFLNDHINLVNTPSSSPMKKKQKSDE